MSNDLRQRAIAAADEVFENGSRTDDIRAALAQIGDGRKTFFDRLAVRAMLEASVDADASDGEQPDVSEADVEGLLAKTGSSTSAPSLRDPKTWMGAKSFFGNDTPFIMKLFAAKVSTPTPRFLRDAADAMGVALSSLKVHFTAGGTPMAAGIERKASGKQTGPEVESFSDAVSASNLPDALKKRWLSE
ncbi:hypothetical protein J5J10_01915 [Ciceribacter sp. L1K23]|uniref:hypothetical protein n=1 Tax=Ciceribacter sp. L1K23 TaxID=2820276 RepID=UPI001B82A2F8|nr:hypothetical protein [Ciceribacter sp. L1K23]MBR0554420.1 hypothetical protein [Ciceribacter sp. L1K23]